MQHDAIVATALCKCSSSELLDNSVVLPGQVHLFFGDILVIVINTFPSVSKSAALIQSRMALGTSATAWAMTARAISGGCSLAASSQTSSDLGQTSTPFMIRFRAAWARPVTSSRRAEAILEI